MTWIDDLSTAWDREYPELDVRALPPMVRLARLSVLIETFQNEVLEPFELTPGDYGVLAALRRSGAPYEMSPSRLYSRLERSSGGMTKILKRLDDQGLVTRSKDPADGRGSKVALTPSGVDVQDRVFNAFLSATKDLLRDIPANELHAVDGALQRLLDAFEAQLS